MCIILAAISKGPILWRLKKKILGLYCLHLGLDCIRKKWPWTPAWLSYWCRNMCISISLQSIWCRIHQPNGRLMFALYMGKTTQMLHFISLINQTILVYLPCWKEDINTRQIMNSQHTVCDVSCISWWLRSTCTHQNHIY